MGGDFFWVSEITGFFGFCVGGSVVWVVVYFGCKCLGFWNFTRENLVLPSC